MLFIPIPKDLNVLIGTFFIASLTFRPLIEGINFKTTFSGFYCVEINRFLNFRINFMIDYKEYIFIF